MNTNRLKIMVLDDEPIVCKRLKPALEKQGYVVDTFTQSSEAMEQIKQVEYDIIITDLKMKVSTACSFSARQNAVRPRPK